MRCVHPAHAGGRLLPVESFPAHPDRTDSAAPFCRICLTIQAASAARIDSGNHNDDAPVLAEMPSPAPVRSGGTSRREQKEKLDVSV